MFFIVMLPPLDYCRLGTYRQNWLWSVIAALFWRTPSSGAGEFKNAIPDNLRLSNHQIYGAISTYNR